MTEEVNNLIGITSLYVLHWLQLLTIWKEFKSNIKLYKIRINKQSMSIWYITDWKHVSLSTDKNTNWFKYTSKLSWKACQHFSTIRPEIHSNISAGLCFDEQALRTKWSLSRIKGKSFHHLSSHLLFYWNGTAEPDLMQVSRMGYTSRELNLNV